MRFREGANVKLVRILLPINQHGTTEACAAAAFSLAERSGALLEVVASPARRRQNGCPIRLSSVPSTSRS